MVDTIPFENISDEPMLNIKAVSQVTGIEAVTLRAWERRYGVPSPSRTDQGYRLYSERDVSILHWLKNRVDSGVTIKHAVAMLHSQLPQQQVSEHSSMDRLLDVDVASSGYSAESFRDMKPALFAAAKGYDVNTAQQIIKQAVTRYSIEDACIHLLIPVLEMVGEAWRQNNITLHQEHFFSNIVREQLHAYSANMPQAWRNETVIIGCAPEDYHEMGGLMLSIFLRRRGWQVIYFGQAVGMARLDEALDALQPTVAVLTSAHVKTAKNLFDAGMQIQVWNGGNTVFVFGGSLFARVPALVSRFPGVYAGDDLVQGLHVVEEILSNSSVHIPAEPFVTPHNLEHLIHDLQVEAVPLSEDMNRLICNLTKLSPIEAATVVADVMHTLEVALAFDLPGLPASDKSMLPTSLQTMGITREDIESIFVDHLGEAHRLSLSPFLSNL